jgi:hypothetical protein
LYFKSEKFRNRHLRIGKSWGMDLRLNSTMPKAQNTLKPTFLTQKVEKYIPMATFWEPFKKYAFNFRPV